MDKLEVVADHLAHLLVLLHEVSEAQTPRTPVAANLTDHILAVRLSLNESIVNLFHRIDGLVIHLLKRLLCVRHSHSHRKENSYDE